MNEFQPAAPIRRVVIVGGGTAGWMVAAAASRFLMDGHRSVQLIESESIGTVGVGEATIPPIMSFNSLLGITEPEFLKATQATYKLGIQFVSWGREQDTYFHQFGELGRDFEGVPFHQLWLKLRDHPEIGPREAYSMSAMAAANGRFSHPGSDRRSPLSDMVFAYHFDAGLYARFLRDYAERGGVSRVEGQILSVDRDGETGHISAVRLEDGREIAGDLFIDCSGFRSLLIGQELDVPFEDWSHWLPCDRAIAVPCERQGPLLPYTISIARSAGWQWRIPLQHRTGNGLVYSSAHLSDDEAEQTLLSSLDAPATAEPNHLRFKAGRRARSWEANVIGIGLSVGFLEPLESTSIHLIQSGISSLLGLFPDSGFNTAERRAYNRGMAEAYDAIRDFIILHYHATQRSDSDFWNHVRTMSVPDSLTERIELFQNRGRSFRRGDELFTRASWVAVMMGQNIEPIGHDPVVDAFAEDELLDTLVKIRATYRQVASRLPAHEDFIRETLKKAR